MAVVTLSCRRTRRHDNFLSNYEKLDEDRKTGANEEADSVPETGGIQTRNLGQGNRVFVTLIWLWSLFQDQHTFTIGNINLARLTGQNENTRARVSLAFFRIHLDLARENFQMQTASRKLRSSSILRFMICILERYLIKMQSDFFERKKWNNDKR